MDRGAVVGGVVDATQIGVSCQFRFLVQPSSVQGSVDRRSRSELSRRRLAEERVRPPGVANDAVLRRDALASKPVFSGHHPRRKIDDTPSPSTDATTWCSRRTRLMVDRGEPGAHEHPPHVLEVWPTSKPAYRFRAPPRLAPRPKSVAATPLLQSASLRLLIHGGHLRF
jgi:hypothetical protein